MNKVIMMGRLTRDPDVRYTQSATPAAVGRFSLAVDRKYKQEGQPEADFFNCIAFGKVGEFVEKYLKKGIKVVVTGRIQNDNYTNKDGQKVYGTQIMVEEIEFAESKSVSEGQQASTQTHGYWERPEQEKDKDGFMNVPDGIGDDLPFA